MEPLTTFTHFHVGLLSLLEKKVCVTPRISHWKMERKARSPWEPEAAGRDARADPDGPMGRASCSLPHTAASVTPTR